MKSILSHNCVKKLTHNRTKYRHCDRYYMHDNAKGLQTTLYAITLLI